MYLQLFHLSSKIVSSFIYPSPIQDCDEVFNYWEPLHYMLHGFGFQTWEYSPRFALRSWGFIKLFDQLSRPASSFLAAGPLQLVSFQNEKIAQFYWIRLVLALSCWMSEVFFINPINHNLPHTKYKCLCPFFFS